MADDFDDDLFNAYNEASDHKPMDNSHESFEDEFADALDTTKDDTHGQQQQRQQDRFMTEDDDNNNGSPPPPPPQRQQQQQQNYNHYTNQQRYYQQNANQQNQQQTVMMGGVPMPYQMALAYQQQMQQMMANPMQFQMMQQQYRQMQQQQQQQQHRRPYQQRPPRTEEDKEALARKMFIGGLDWDTTDDGLKDYFSKFGPVEVCSVMRDMATGQSRGFAFITMANAADIDKVLDQADHFVDGKKIDPKRAVARSDPVPPNQQQQQDDAATSNAQSEKIFVGGISPAVDREEFKSFFEQFGAVADATLMMDRQTGKPRGFGFITFEDASSVERALDANPADLEIKEKRVEIKRATPKTRASAAAAAARHPNTRYAGAAQGFQGRPGMYPNQQQQQPYAAMAAAYYGAGGSGGRMNQQQQQQDDGNDDYDRRSHRDHRDHHHHRSSRHRDGSRDDRYRDERSGGGAVHASSSSRNQSSYRPY